MKVLAAAVVALLLAGCSLMPSRMAPGTPRAEIEQRLGRPTAVLALPDGVRLQYSYLPAGQEVHNLDLDAQGRLRRVEQVMDQGWLDRNVRVDVWTTQDALRELGRPAWVEQVASFKGDVWTYRFREPTGSRQAHLHFDPSGVLRRFMYTDEPEFERDLFFFLR